MKPEEKPKEPKTIPSKAEDEAIAREREMKERRKARTLAHREK